MRLEKENIKTTEENLKLILAPQLYVRLDLQLWTSGSDTQRPIQL